MRLLPRPHTAEEDLVALLDGEVTLPERVTLERHLGGCERCAGLLARHERARRALAMELAVDPLETQAAPQHWRLRAGATAAGAGVLAGSVGALLVAGLLVRRRHRRIALRPIPAA
jgi:anti-sigma factor RsiW